MSVESSFVVGVEFMIIRSSRIGLMAVSVVMSAFVTFLLNHFLLGDGVPDWIVDCWLMLNLGPMVLAVFFSPNLSFFGLFALVAQSVQWALVAFLLVWALDSSESAGATDWERNL